MAAALKVISGGKLYDFPWYHDLIKAEEEPAETESEIMERIKNGVNNIGGSNDGPI